MIPFHLSTGDAPRAEGSAFLLGGDGYDRIGSIGVEISTDELLPLRDTKADETGEEIILRRRN
jgi:hypothetical protein